MDVIVEYHLRSKETILEWVNGNSIMEIMDRIAKMILSNEIIYVKESFKATRYIALKTNSIDYYSINGGNE